MNIKHLVLSCLLMVSSQELLAGATTFTPQSLSSISSSQNGYAFSNWKTGMSCTIEDKGRIVFIKADVGPTITMYDSVTTAPSNYQGAFADQSMNVNGTAFSKRTYSVGSIVFSSVAATVSGGAYVFTVSTSTGTHNIALFPNGFYVSKTSNNLYLPGC